MDDVEETMMQEQCPKFYKEKIKTPKKRRWIRQLIGCIKSLFKEK